MRYKEEIFWNPNSSRVEFIPVLSKENEKKQYVQDVIENFKFDTDKTVVYACGSDAMILNVKNNLLNSELLESDFTQIHLFNQIQ